MKHYKLVKELPTDYFKVGQIYAEDTYFRRSSMSGYSEIALTSKVWELVEEYKDNWIYVGDYEKKEPMFSSVDFV